VRGDTSKPFAAKYFKYSFTFAAPFSNFMIEPHIQYGFNILSHSISVFYKNLVMN
jgi:hypothetical protein